MSASSHTPVSAYLITFNNERTIEAALKSLDWVDEIVVVDSFSTDRTPEIVRRYTDRFEQRAWPGFRDQYQYASEQCRHDWVVFLDADEEIAPELADEMKDALRRHANTTPDARTAGYHACRRTFFLGRWILHGAWVPDHEIRLYDRRRGAWKGGLHAKVHVDGPEATFRNFIYHYTYTDLADQHATIDRYTTTAAGDLVQAGKPFSLLKLVCNPPLRFLRDYVLKRGFLDGLPGFIIAVNNAHYAFLKYAKHWEATRRSDPERERAARPRVTPSRDAQPPSEDAS